MLTEGHGGDKARGAQRRLAVGVLRLSSYQGGYLLVTVSTHGDFIMLSHWKTRVPEPGSDIPLSHII